MSNQFNKRNYNHQRNGNSANKTRKTHRNNSRQPHPLAKLHEEFNAPFRLNYQSLQTKNPLSLLSWRKRRRYIFLSSSPVHYLLLEQPVTNTLSTSWIQIGSTAKTDRTYTTPLRVPYVKKCLLSGTISSNHVRHKRIVLRQTSQKISIPSYVYTIHEIRQNFFKTNLTTWTTSSNQVTLNLPSSKIKYYASIIKSYWRWRRRQNRWNASQIHLLLSHVNKLEKRIP